VALTPTDDRTRRRLLAAYLHTTVSMVRSDSPDLTDRQKAVLLKVYLDDEPQTVRGLAEYCKISKPAITRALDRLAEFDLIRRQTDPHDRRSVIVRRTQPGQTYVRQIETILTAATTSPPRPVPV
jgi:DNA-binding MarR family transcriptional regulator